MFAMSSNPNRLSISQMASAKPPVAQGDAAYLDGLNPEQREAVLTTEGPLLVLAGAGTGKTRVLTTRLAHIIGTRLAWPSQTLTVTFTNKAAREMRERALSMLGEAGEGLRWLGTFHSISAQILRKHAELAGLKSTFTIIDTDDQWYHLGGGALYGESESDEGLVLSNSWLQGSFLLEEDQADSIFDEGVSLTLQQYAVENTAYPGARYILFNGQLTGFGLEGEAIDMTGLVAATSIVGNPCEEELIGGVRLRDTSGTWWDVEFHMDQETWQIDSDLCDGCGTVTHNGTEYGEVCVDASELLQWELRPW